MCYTVQAQGLAQCLVTRNTMPQHMVQLGGTLGTVLGSVAALLLVVFIFAIYMKVFKRQMKRERNVRVSSFGYTMKILIITVIPVLLSTTIYNISGIIDQGIFKQVALLQGYTQNDIDVWWGVYTGKYKLLINVPISIASAMAAYFVPVFTAHITGTIWRQ